MYYTQKRGGFTSHPFIYFPALEKKRHDLRHDIPYRCNRLELCKLQLNRVGGYPLFE